MTMLDELMVATQHIIGWEEGAAELARLRRMADAFAADNRVGQCDACGNYVHPAIDTHAATCDVAIHLGLPREKGDGE